MTQIRRINYSNDKRITAIKAQPIDGYVWVAFAKNSDDVCILEKQFKFQLNQTFFSIEKEVNEILSLDLDSSNLYLAYDDSELLGEILSLSNPISFTTEIEIPGGITESPVDVHVNGSDLWFLIPGNDTGSNAKLLLYDTFGTFQLEIDLTRTGEEVLNAS